MRATGFRTAGGPGSIFADLDALEVVAARHRTNGEDGVGLGGRVNVVVWGNTMPPRVCRSAALLNERMAEAAAELDRLGRRMHELGRRTRRAAEAYRDAESGAAVWIGSLDPGAGLAPTPAPGATWSDGVSSADLQAGVTDAVTAPQVKAYTALAHALLLLALQHVPVLGPMLAAAKAAKAAGEQPAWQRLGGKAGGMALKGQVEGLVHEGVDGGLLPVLSPAQALTVIAAVIATDPLYPIGGTVVVEGRPRPRSATPDRLTGSAAELAALVPRQGGEDGAGAITVTCVHGPEGPVWVVGLPGTEGPVAPVSGGENPFDGNGVWESYLGDPALNRGIEEALAHAGAAPGAPVAFVGYSQGGLRAVNAVNDPRFTARHPVASLVTIGAPGAGQTVPARVPALDFTAGDDVMDAVDGGGSPVGPNRATVTLAAEQAVDLDATEAAIRETMWSESAGEPATPWDAVAEKALTLVEAGEDAEDILSTLEADLARGHGLDLYQERIAAFEAADPADRAEVAALQEAVGHGLAGDVVSSQTFTLRRLPPIEDPAHVPVAGVSG